MKLIIGLGNSGPSFEGSRHNIGFSVVDEVARAYDQVWQNKPKLLGQIARPVIEGRPVLLLKPSTLYNDAGRSAQLVKQFYGVASHDILVVHDELALPFKTIRTRPDGHDAGNNGVKSLNAHLGEQFFRIRIGIDQPERTTSDTEFVLGKFSRQESPLLPQLRDKASLIINDFIADIFTPTSYTTL